MAGPIRCAVIDDDPEWIEAAVRALRLVERPIETLTFGDARSALSTLDRCAVDVVVTDLRMPMIDGLTFIEEFRLKNRRTPIVAMSSLDLLGRDALRAGANAFVDKHTLSTTLAPTVLELVDRSAPASAPGVARESLPGTVA